MGVYWTAFIGLFFDYYDLYLFVYLEKVLAADFGLILAGFAPVLITALGLHHGANYFLFSAALGLGVLVMGWGMTDERV